MARCRYDEVRLHFVIEVRPTAIFSHEFFFSKSVGPTVCCLAIILERSSGLSQDLCGPISRARCGFVEVWISP